MPDVGVPYLGVARSFTDQRWQERIADARLIQAIAQRTGLPELIARVLVARGVGPEAAVDFLNPTLKRLLPDPSALRDMDAAAERLGEAIVKSETVAVFGDYDVDGATSSALLARFFAAVGRPLRTYIPDRITEGYGPNGPALERLKSEGVDIAITVDCGISAFEALDRAAACGLEMIVVDHHLAEPRLPQATAVVNPNRLDDDSGCGMLAAVGVTFLLLIALNRELRAKGWYKQVPEPDLLQWLDIVALGTVCDVVPLKGLNRALVAQGLKVLGRRNNPGLRALADVAGIDSRPGTFHLGYILGPRVNAGGRVGRSDLGSRLLASNDEKETVEIAGELDRLNKERQAIEAMVLEQALAQAEELDAAKAGMVLVHGADWHPGVIGIVASRLKDRYGKPAFVLGGEGAAVKGSGRSVPGVDLGSVVTAARQAELLVNGGGHAMAAGLTVEADRVDELRQFMAERVAQLSVQGSSTGGLNIDGSISVGGANRELFDLLQQAGPYGAGHSEPRFAITGAKVIKATRVGSDHVSLILAGEGSARLRAISFRTADRPLGRELLAAQGHSLHLAGHLRADDWQGRNGVQLAIDDAAPAGGLL